jgi:hypothetical protein
MTTARVRSTASLSRIRAALIRLSAAADDALPAYHRFVKIMMKEIAKQKSMGIAKKMCDLMLQSKFCHMASVSGGQLMVW